MITTGFGLAVWTWPLTLLILVLDWPLSCLLIWYFLVVLPGVCGLLYVHPFHFNFKDNIRLLPGELDLCHNVCTKHKTALRAHILRPDNISRWPFRLPVLLQAASEAWLIALTLAAREKAGTHFHKTLCCWYYSFNRKPVLLLAHLRKQRMRLRFLPLFCSPVIFTLTSLLPFRVIEA